jgi:hypothetical protein
MAQFKAFDTKVEVVGEGVFSLLAALSWNQTLAKEILARHGIINPQAGKWYPQQAILDTYREIAETMGVHTLYQIGAKIPENAIFPAEIDSVEKALASLDIGYHLNHRGGEIGYYRLDKMESNRAVLVCYNPYPCDFDQGIIVGTVRRFAGGTTVLVNERHDESKGCRKLGGASCTYIVEWLLSKERKSQV